MISPEKIPPQHYIFESLNAPAEAAYHIVVVGTGAVFEEKVQKALDYLGAPTERIVFDIDPRRLDDVTANGALKVLADGLNPPFRLTPEQAKQYIAFIATPEHLTVIKSLTEVGVRNFIVEKPLVNNKTEIKKLKTLRKKHPDLKVYPMDFYVQKLAMLQALTGTISADDPRRSWIETDEGEPVPENLFGQIKEYIGDIEGIDVTILEGGNFGLPDLVKRPWLEKDKKRGGMLLDLGTHTLAPLLAAGIVSAETTTVISANRFAIGKDRKSYVSATPRQPEMYAIALLSVRSEKSEFPLQLTVGKTFQDGGIWKMFIRGSKGNITVGLRTGDHLTIQTKGGKDFQLRLKPGSDAYKLAFEEANAYFRGERNFDGNLDAMLGSLDIISRIKKTSNRK